MTAPVPFLVVGAAAVVLAGVEEVRPDEPGVVLVTITNVGSTVEAYDLEVLGELRDVATVAPAQVRLLPGQQEVAAVTIVAGTGVPAGPVAFGLRVVPHSGEAVVEERELQVAPVTRLSIRAVPMVLRARRRGEARVEVENTGNTPVTAELSAIDPNEELAAAFRPAQLTVAPHDVGTARVALRSLAPRGASIGYTIRARTPGGVEQQVDARMETSRRRLGPVVVIGAVLLLAAVAAGRQVGAGDAEANTTNVTSAAADPSSTVADPGSTTNVTQVATTLSGPADTGGAGTTATSSTPAGSSTPTEVTPVPGSPGPGGASTTTSTTRAVPPSVTTRPVPPCQGTLCASVARNSGPTQVLNTREAARDANGDPVFVSSVTQPRHGTVTIGDAGHAVFYRPASGYVGPDEFTVTVRDSSGGTASEVMKINVY